MPRIENLPAGSSAQRNNLNHQAIEDYLKTIYTLAEEESPVSTSRIAAMRGVKPASATSMIQRLAALELVNYEKHYGVTLTETGRHIALEVIRHHRLIELYLTEALGFTWDEVHEQADILEHVISEKLEERIAAALGYPTLDPHGDPIPAPDGRVPTPPARQLSVCDDGDTGTVARISDADPEMLRYFDSVGISLDSRLQVLARRDFAGMISVAVKSADASENDPGTTVDLGSPAAEAIWVIG